MTKLDLELYLIDEGMTPDEAATISYDFKRGLRVLNEIKKYDNDHA